MKLRQVLDQAVDVLPAVTIAAFFAALLVLSLMHGCRGPDDAPSARSSR